MADKKLKRFEGIDTVKAGIEIRNAAGGLNEALGIDPEEWHKGDEVFVVLRCKVDKLRFDPIKDQDGWKRVHITRALSAAVVDRELVIEVLDAQAQRIEQANGIMRLPLDPMVQAHNEGEHTELVDDCPLCQAERDAAATGD